MSDKQKEKRFYTITVTPNKAQGETKYYRSRFNILKVCLTFSILIAVFGTILTAFELWQMKRMEDQIGVFREIIAKQDERITELGDDNTELKQRNDILLSTVGRQEIANAEQEEINREKAFPDAFPLTDSATMAEVDTEAGDYVPIVVFNMSDASDVVASADGVVTSVREDQDYGYCIVIDHGNGYVSYYRNGADPKVNEGDNVVRGAILFVGGLENNKLGYQITLDGQYIDPMTVLAING